MGDFGQESPIQHINSHGEGPEVPCVGQTGKLTRDPESCLRRLSQLVREGGWKFGCAAGWLEFGDGTGRSEMFDSPVIPFLLVSPPLG